MDLTVWTVCCGKNQKEFSNIPLEHTPNPQPIVYEGFLSIWRFGDARGMLQGYVGVLLENKGDHRSTMGQGKEKESILKDPKG